MCKSVVYLQKIRGMMTGMVMVLPGEEAEFKLPRASLHPWKLPRPKLSVLFLFHIPTT